MNGTPQRLVVAEPAPQSSRGNRTAQGAAWSVLGLAGFLFFAVGVVDLLLVWYPLSFGTPVWEFVTITLTLNGLPAPVIGLALMAASAVAQGHDKRARLFGFMLGLTAVVVVVAAVLFATNVPIAINAQIPELPRIGINKAIMKVAAQAVLYPVGLLWMARYVWRGARSGEAETSKR